MKTEPNEPINPKISSRRGFESGNKSEGYTDIKQSGGLTKREYFAAMAMQGYRSNPEYAQTHPEIISSLSVQGADYLINALNTPTKQ